MGPLNKRVRTAVQPCENELKSIRGQFSKLPLPVPTVVRDPQRVTGDTADPSRKQDQSVRDPPISELDSPVPQC